MDTPFTPLLSQRDWNEEWKALQRSRHHADDPAAWDAKAKSFPVKHGSQTPYADSFLALAAIEHGESVMDMGCGTGALAIPLAQEGHAVTACDFSRGMLSVMEKELESLDIHSVKVVQMSWEDDWAAFGIEPKSVDVAFASRSIATADLQDSLLKLSTVARRRCCITLPCGPSPKVNEELLEAAGLPARLGNDFLYGFNILASLGFHPEVAYIPSARREIFPTRAKALETYVSMIHSALSGVASEEELDRVPNNLDSWLDEHLKTTDQGFELDEVRSVLWAFIAWSVC